MSRKIIVFITTCLLAIGFLLVNQFAGPSQVQTSPFVLPTSGAVPTAYSSLMQVSPTNSSVLAEPPEKSQAATLIEPTNPRKLVGVYNGNSYSTGGNSMVKWTSGAEQLYYRVDGSWWQFSVQARSRTVLLPGFEIAPTPLVAVQRILPINASLIKYSPSGKAALFTMPIGEKVAISTIPTEKPPVSGEMWVGPNEVELWFTDGKTQARLGVVQNCLGEFTWSPDETKVIIVRSGRGEHCTIDVWKIDLEELKIESLFPRKDFLERVSIKYITLDLTKLVFLSGGQDYLLDILSLEIRRINIPPKSILIWFQGKQAIIAMDVSTSKAWKIGEYDLESARFTEWFSSQDEPLVSGLKLNEAKLSPDKAWLALTTGIDMYHIEGIWLLPCSLGAK